MKTLAAVVCLSLVALGARAAPDDAAEKYLVLSRIGDALSIVTYRPTVGTRVDNNVHDIVATPDHAFDRVALRSAEAAVRRAKPSSSVTLLGSTSTDPYPEHEAFVDDRKLTAPDWLSGTIAGCGCTRLILITKHSADARIVGAHSITGSGKLTGLGFYIDRYLRTKRGNTGERGLGFISPFVYIEVALIDARDGRLLAQQVVTTSRMISAARSATGADPWEALSAEEKSRAIESIIEREVPSSITALLAS